MDTTERFESEIAEHVMTVIRDDGEYRHLRFQKPGTRAMSFDLLTWPGHLCYTGDMGTYVFSRVRDMLEFFRSPKGDWRDINLPYWAEKVLAKDRDGIKEYCLDKFKQNIREWLADYIDGHDLSTAEIDELRDEVEHEVIRAAAEHFVSRGADDLSTAAACGYTYNCRPVFQDFWEVDSTVYTHRYTWCCHAIVWGIAQYDTANAEAAPA